MISIENNPRKPLTGMMLHMDGSTHDWLGSGIEYDIVTIIDDANNRMYYIELVKEEDLLTCMKLIYNAVQKNGIFCSLYINRVSHF